MPFYTAMPYFTFTSYHTSTLRAAQYNQYITAGHWELSSTDQLGSHCLKPQTSWLQGHCHPSSVNTSPHLSLILFSMSECLLNLTFAIHLLLFFTLPLCLVSSVCPVFHFFLSHFLSCLAVPHGLYFPLSLSDFITFSSLPHPFVSKTFVFNCLCFSFGLSGFLCPLFCLFLGFSFLLQSLAARQSQISPFKPCYPLYPCAGHLPGHYKGRSFPSP